MNNTSLIRLSGINYTYEANDDPAIQDISFSVKQGEWLWIVGPGGSGKTTICELICGILQSRSEGLLQGEILIAGLDMSSGTAERLAGQVGVIFQDPETALIHEYVEDELAFAPENLCVAADEIEKRMEQTLTDMDIQKIRHHQIDILSGGQKQRVSIASVLTMKPKILVLDEPTANLDNPSAKKLMSILIELHHKGHTIITLSSRINEHCDPDRLIILNQGQMSADITYRELSPQHKELLTQLGCWLNKKDCSTGAEIEESDLNTSISACPILQVCNLSFGYHQNKLKLKDDNKNVLHEINLELYEGDFLALLGPNGSGKTTFGKLLSGILSPPKGSIFIREQDVTDFTYKQLAQTVGYVFQNPDHQFVADTVMEECIFGLKGAQHDADMGWLEGEKILKKFGLYHQRSRNPHQLSISEKRLLNLASVLVLQPDIIVLDEPTAGLDYISANRLISYCADYTKQGKIAVMITHDVQTIHKWSTKELVLVTN